jgi:hypothetical protein
LLRNLLERRIDQHVRKAVEKPTEEKNWSTCVKSCCETCWHRLDHVWWVAIYLFHGRTCCRSVRDGPIPLQNLLTECAQCIDSGAKLLAGMCAMYLFTVSMGCIMHRVHTSIYILFAMMFQIFET